MDVVELNHVALHVADVEASVRFYRDVLGLPESPRPAFNFPGAWFRFGATQELHLIGGREEAVNGGSRGTHFALRVASVEAVRAFLAAKGIEPARDPKLRPDGALQMFITDPDGHFIEFSEAPPAK